MSELFRKIGEKEFYVVRDDVGRIVVSDELLNVLLDDFEKQIPKKPYLDQKGLLDVKMWYCPECNKKVISDWNKNLANPYCHNCGQKLDWKTDF